MSKKLSKYISGYYYFVKALMVLSATSGGINIIFFTSVIGVPVRIASASFSLIFSLTTGIIKKVLKITRYKKKNHDKIVMFARSKLNSIETLMSQALIDLETGHEEFKTIINEEESYSRLKENIKMIKSNDETDELMENNKNITKNSGNG